MRNQEFIDAVKGMKDFDSTQALAFARLFSTHFVLEKGLYEAEA